MKKIIISILVLIGLGIIGYVVVSNQAKQAAIAKIASFEDCAKYFPVRESFPEQCATSDGKLFTREIEDVEPEPELPDTWTGETQDPRIRVTFPTAGATITSPLVVKGEARGTWYFEASFPVKLVDEQGNTIVQTYAQAQGEWMTENFVPFESTVTFATATSATSGKGMLVLERDNPSGLPENDASVRIPVQW